MFHFCWLVTGCRVSCTTNAHAPLSGPQQRLPALAGKSTLLDLIAGRKTIGELHGDILFSGIRPTQAFLRRYTGAPLLQLFPSDGFHIAS